MSNDYQILQGTSTHIDLPDNSVHTIITSPPYWGLRAYGSDLEIWDVKDTAPKECKEEGKHIWVSAGEIINRGGSPNTLSEKQLSNPGSVNAIRSQAGYFCAICHAWKGELGSEPSPDLYIRHMVQVFHEAKRVLRKDGTCWINIGDSYSGSLKGVDNNGKQYIGGETQQNNVGSLGVWHADWEALGMKPKDMIGIPGLLAQALKADGWYWRAFFPWVKLNGMPGSQDDRPTMNIEWWILLSKTKYTYYDQEVIKLPAKFSSAERKARAKMSHKHAPSDKVNGTRPLSGKMNSIDPAPVPASQNFHRESGKVLETEVPGQVPQHRADREDSDPDGLRIRRASDWWNESVDIAIDQLQVQLNHLRMVKRGGMMLNEEGDPLAVIAATGSTGDEHYAAYPIKLIEPMILASTSEKGVCPKCGAPWVRQVEEISRMPWEDRKAAGAQTGSTEKGMGVNLGEGMPHELGTYSTTIGWAPSCKHTDLEPIPATVMDMFCGTGTTGAAALILGRRAILQEIKDEYIAISVKRLNRIVRRGEVETKKGEIQLGFDFEAAPEKAKRPRRSKKASTVLTHPVPEPIKLHPAQQAAWDAVPEKPEVAMVQDGKVVPLPLPKATMILPKPSPDHVLAEINNEWTWILPEKKES